MTYKKLEELPVFELIEYGENRLPNPPKNREASRWAGGNMPVPPKVGEQVRVIMNTLGEATVTGYFTECGYLGIRITLANPPAWYLKQNGGNVEGHVFGTEIEPL